jgi:deazaflavin-dependent oxidoreductase (nitroreductase family)
MANVHDWNKKVIDEFRANHGKVGGQFEGAPMLLLHHKGRKSGEERVNPLVYLKDGDRIFIFGSKGGFPTHPDWYKNVLKDPNAAIEIGDEKYDVVAENITGEAHDRLYAKQVEAFPVFAEYQQRATERTIPVVALTRK